MGVALRRFDAACTVVDPAVWSPSPDAAATPTGPSTGSPPAVGPPAVGPPVGGSPTASPSADDAPAGGPFGGGPFGAGAGDLYDCEGKADAIRANADAAPREQPGGFPGGLPDLPEGVEAEDMIEVAQCIVEHGGDPFELATGEPPSQATQDALEAC